jgi:uncharacterized protein with PQ loop repeat
VRLNTASVSGWAGLALIHGSTLPTIIQALATGSSPDLPLSLVLMVWSGLALFLVNAILTRNMLYISSNAIGFAGQSVMLMLVLF